MTQENRFSKQQILAGNLRDSWVHSYPLDTAKTGFEVLVDGDFIHAWTDGNLADIYVQLNNKSIPDNILYFARRNPILQPFEKFYLTHPAQAGRTLDIMVGRDGRAGDPLGGVTSPQRPFVIRSDKDSHFTGAIAQNAIESENLTALLTSTLKITGVSIQSDQKLDYRLIFWRKDTMEDTDLDVDAFCGETRMNLPLYGFQIAGANQWYMDKRGLDIDYEDDDASKELHVSLQNLSATSKNAGATGEVIIEVYYSLRG